MAFADEVFKKVRIPRIFFRVNRRENWLKGEDGLTVRTEAKSFDDCWKEDAERRSWDCASGERISMVEKQDDFLY